MKTFPVTYVNHVLCGTRENKRTALPIPMQLIYNLGVTKKSLLIEKTNMPIRTGT